jgi:hypothetical protein
MEVEREGRGMALGRQKLWEGIAGEKRMRQRKEWGLKERDEDKNKAIFLAI